jgi:hypothetical protein
VKVHVDVVVRLRRRTLRRILHWTETSVSLVEVQLHKICT